MTDKELRRMNRRDLLRLLLAQSKESQQQQEDNSSLSTSLAEAEQSIVHLKEQLEKKEHELERLKAVLEEREKEKRLSGTLPAFQVEKRCYSVEEAATIFREVLVKLSEKPQDDQPEAETQGAGEN